jgi:hypothetical protein
LLLTVPAVAVNVPLLEPAPIVMLAGTANSPVLLDRLTVTALVAALVRVTVQLALCPFFSLPGGQFTDLICVCPDRFSVAVCETPLAVAVMIAVSSAVIAATVTVNPAEVAPEATVTLPGTVAFPLLLDSATASPPPGAAPLKVTVQLEVPGAFTLDGLQDKPLGNTPAVKLTGVLTLSPFRVAVSAAVWALLTVPAVAVNVPLLALAAIVTLAGTVSKPVLLDRLAVIVVDAALFSVTVQVALCPVPSVLGEQLTLNNCAGPAMLNENVRETLLAVAVSVAV